MVERAELWTTAGPTSASAGHDDGVVEGPARPPGASVRRVRCSATRTSQPSGSRAVVTVSGVNVVPSAGP